MFTVCGSPGQLARAGQGPGDPGAPGHGGHEGGEQRGPTLASLQPGALVKLPGTLGLGIIIRDY